MRSSHLLCCYVNTSLVQFNKKIDNFLQKEIK